MRCRHTGSGNAQLALDVAVYEEQRADPRGELFRRWVELIPGEPLASGRLRREIIDGRI